MSIFSKIFSSKVPGEYIYHIENIEIPIYHNEILIGEITSQTVCRKVLRAFYCSYETSLIITEIVEQGGYLRRVNINIEFRKLADNS